MTDQEAHTIYDQGREVTVRILVDLSAENDNLQKRAKVFEKETPTPTTPSGAIPPYQKDNLSRKRKKKPGRQKGHPGSARKTPDHVDDVQEHHLDACPQCGGPVAELKKTRSRFVEGIAKLLSRVTEHKIFQSYCSHCKKIVEPKVVEAMPNSLISLRTLVEAAWLHYLVGMSLNNIVSLFAQRGLVLTCGGLTHAFVRLADLLEPSYDGILQYVKTSAVLMADETSWRISGVTHWLWYFGTKTWAYYVIDRHRGSEVVKRVMGTLLSGILLCDFWAAYNCLQTLAKQRCLYHLFTELTKVDLRNQHSNWQDFKKKLARLLKDAIRLAASHKTITPTAYSRRKDHILLRLQELLAVDWIDRDARRLIKRLRRHQKELFVFLDYPETVSPYNNHSEQQMRKAVLVRRISHGNRSLAGAKAQAIFMSLFRSLELQGKNPVESVLDIAQAHIKGLKNSLISQSPMPSAAHSPSSENDSEAVIDQGNETSVPFIPRVAQAPP